MCKTPLNSQEVHKTRVLVLQQFYCPLPKASNLTTDKWNYERQVSTRWRLQYFSSHFRKPEGAIACSLPREVKKNAWGAEAWKQRKYFFLEQIFLILLPRAKLIHQIRSRDMRKEYLHNILKCDFFMNLSPTAVYFLSFSIDNSQIS